MRTVIVGDVHGCARELEELLDLVAFGSGDRLVFVGDLIARGPDTLGVLDVVRRTGALLVRGNHEQRLFETPVPKHHAQVARMLRPVDWTIIRASKTSLSLPEHGLLVVHAGIDPAVALAEQRDETLMRIRTVLGPGVRGKRQVLWGTQWNGPPHIVFGHNAAPGLQLHPWATGLDTGCVYGGRLTALVLAENQKVPRAIAARQKLLVSVAAKRVWSVPEKHGRAALSIRAR